MKISPVYTSSSSSSSVSFFSTFSVSMSKIWATFLVLVISISIISARPTNINRQKRQSDQRLAELETLLALQKYNGHRVRGWPGHNDLSPGFGLIDFDKIGRRKKSTRFSPGYEGKDKMWSSWILKGSRPSQNLPNYESESQVDQK